MRVVIIGPAYPFRGGIAAFNDRLAKALKDAGHDVIVHTFKLQYPGFLFPGKSQYSEDPPPEGITIVRSVHSLNPINWIRTGLKIKALNPDLVLVRFWLPFMGPALGTIARIVRRSRKTKVFAFIDNIIPHEKRPGDRLFTRYFTGSVHGFIVMSRTVLEDLKQFDRSRPVLLTPHPLYDHYGNALSKKTARQKLGLSAHHKVLLFFGLIREYKGLDLLIEAFADPRLRTGEYRLIIAGEFYASRAPYDALIRKYALGAEIIQVDHYIPNEEVKDYFSASDLVVQPYKTATQSGITQIAYHFNKPMIVTDVGGLAEMCPDGKVGYVVQPEAAAIANAILRFFNETDLEKIRSLIHEQKKKYSWEILVERIIKLTEHEEVNHS